MNKSKRTSRGPAWIFAVLSVAFFVVGVASGVYGVRNRDGFAMFEFAALTVIAILCAGLSIVCARQDREAREAERQIDKEVRLVLNDRNLPVNRTVRVLRRNVADGGRRAKNLKRDIETHLR